MDSHLRGYDSRETPVINTNVKRKARLYLIFDEG